MGNYNIAQLIEETDLIKKDIQNAVKAIREKGGQSDTYATSDLANQIHTIPSYVPGSTLGIDTNGSFWVGEYETVNVNVQSGGGKAIVPAGVRMLIGNVSVFDGASFEFAQGSSLEASYSGTLTELHNIDMHNLTSYGLTSFQGATALQLVDGLDIRNLTDTPYYMFGDCSQLTTFRNVNIPLTLDVMGFLGYGSGVDRITTFTASPDMIVDDSYNLDLPNIDRETVISWLEAALRSGVTGKFIGFSDIHIDDPDNYVVDLISALAKMKWTVSGVYFN